MFVQVLWSAATERTVRLWEKSSGNPGKRERAQSGGLVPQSGWACRYDLSPRRHCGVMDMIIVFEFLDVSTYLCRMSERLFIASQFNRGSSATISSSLGPHSRCKVKLALAEKRREHCSYDSTLRKVNQVDTAHPFGGFRPSTGPDSDPFKKQGEENFQAPPRGVLEKYAPFG